MPTHRAQRAARAAAREAPGRRSGRRARAAGRRRDRCARRARARPGRPAARRDRVRRSARPRRRPLFVEAARRLERARPGARARDVSGGARGRHVQRRCRSRRRAGGGARRAGGARRTAPPRAPDLLLDAFAIRLTDGYEAAVPTCARALELLLRASSDEDVSRRLSVSSTRDGNIVALELWDDEALHLLAARQVQLARDTGALVHLQFALSFLARSHMLAGELTAATLMLDEARLIAEATGNPALVNAPMILAAWRGDEARASELIEATSEEAAARRWTSIDCARPCSTTASADMTPPAMRAWEAMQPDPLGTGRNWCPSWPRRASRTADRALLESALDWLSERTARDWLWVGEWARSACARAAERGRGRRAVCTASRSTHLARTRVRVELARDSPALWRVAAPRTSPCRRANAAAHRA